MNDLHGIYSYSINIYNYPIVPELPTYQVDYRQFFFIQEISSKR